MGTICRNENMKYDLGEKIPDFVWTNLFVWAEFESRMSIYIYMYVMNVMNMTEKINFNLFITNTISERK